MFGLCDCNNFFVSCERVFNPSLEGRAVVVLSNNDGCVIARSNEVKSMGVKMGQPLFQIKNLVDSGRVTIISSNITLYADMSRRVMRTIENIISPIEVYSIDEAFIDLSNINKDSFKELGKNICYTVKRDTGIPLSIGIAPTKTLAKIASKLSKQYPKLNGSCIMTEAKDIEKVLKNFPIGDVWGVGRQSCKKLNIYGVSTAYDFTQKPEHWVKSIMGVGGAKIWNELNSIPCINFEDTPKAKQQIHNTRTFSNEICDFDELNGLVASFTSMCGEKLRRQKSLCSELTVFICTNQHKENAPQYNKSFSAQIDIPTDSTLELIKIATNTLKSIFVNGYGYKKAGVIVSKIRDNTYIQQSLFDSIDREKHKNIMRIMDNINNIEGIGTITVASQKNIYKNVNRNHISQRYTTEWSEILTIKI